jgi:hypothetical protein
MSDETADIRAQVATLLRDPAWRQEIVRQLLAAPRPRPPRPRADKPKYQDGRRNNGGARPGAGRKPKHEEVAAQIARLLKPKPAPMPRREARAAKLLRDVAALIPAGLPADVREEAAQAIVVDLVARKLTRRQLDARTVRAYVRAAYGLREGYRFRSLDAPASPGDERTLGELLAA